jgi:hypothetical protein
MLTQQGFLETGLAVNASSSRAINGRGHGHACQYCSSLGIGLMAQCSMRAGMIRKGFVILIEAWLAPLPDLTRIRRSFGLYRVFADLNCLIVEQVAPEKSSLRISRSTKRWS